MGAVPSTITPHTLETPRGSLRGIQFTNNLLSKKVYTRYTKIPYALPPVGSLRWRRPQPLPDDFSFNSADGTPGDYSQFGPICPQPVYAMADAMVPPSSEGALPAGMMAKPIENLQDEDCLYVNIWVPEGKPPAEGWPVQFFIRKYLIYPLRIGICSCLFSISISISFPAYIYLSPPKSLSHLTSQTAAGSK
jgi:hypothetical protein